MCPAINQQSVLSGTVSFDGWRKQEEHCPGTSQQHALSHNFA